MLKRAGEVSRFERPHQTLLAWAEDICVVRECIDGFVWKEIKGYETLFACPVCDRHDRDLHPYPCIPSAKHWWGRYSVYTPDEMDARRRERQEKAEEIRRGASRAPELETEGIGA